ncbi:MAG: hypothetical protein IPH42_00530 [Bacteroidetes bacterium]|jgi:hypothetical protein|nr:hypothetical protein [Bacteroidota bacterium]
MQDFKNIQTVKYFIFSILGIIFFISSCKKEIVEEVIYDNIIYQIDTVPVYQSNTEKDRLKTPIQYISSLYSNLAFSSIPTTILDNLVIYRLSIGDKTLVNELILNAMLEDPAVTAMFPTNAEMRDDIDAFINESYLRFYLRNPTAYEKYSLHNIIENDEDITVTDVFRAFLLSNEYMFY